MQEIDQHISTLLYDHDCVIVPSLGGFLASYSGASIHPVQHTISPPARKVAFNVFLKQNDGLLANHLSGYEHTSYLEAIGKIEAYAAACQRELHAGKRVVIEGVGILYNDSEHNLQFESSPSANFLKDSFGFSPIRHLPLSREEQQQPAKQVKEFVTIRPSVKQDRKKTVTGGSTKKVLSRIIIAGAVIWMSVNVFLVLKNNKENLAGNSSAPGTELPVSKKETSSRPSPSQASVQPPAHIESTAAILTIPETTRIEISEDRIEPANEPISEPISKPASQLASEPIAMHEQKNFSEKEIMAPAPAVTIQKADQKAVPENKVAEGAHYFIIAGAFKIPENASSFVARLQAEGFSNARILSGNGKLTMVCYDAAATRHEAARLLDSIRTNKRDGWVLAN